MPLDGAPFSLTNLDLFLGRNDHIKDTVAHSHRFDALFEVIANFFLVTRITMDHIPGASIFVLLRVDLVSGQVFSTASSSEEECSRKSIFSSSDAVDRSE